WCHIFRMWVLVDGCPQGHGCGEWACCGGEEGDGAQQHDRVGPVAGRGRGVKGGRPEDHGGGERGGGEEGRRHAPAGGGRGAGRMEAKKKKAPEPTIEVRNTSGALAGSPCSMIQRIGATTESGQPVAIQWASALAAAMPSRETPEPA